MSTFTINPTYYQVTWSISTPTNYTTLTGNQSGSIDPTDSFDTNRVVSITGTTAISSNVMNNGETIVINTYPITFTSADVLSNIITKINASSKLTGVYADQNVAADRLTLFNAVGFEGQPFSLVEGNGTALSKLGLRAGGYKHYPTIVGGSFTNVTTGMNVTINGTGVTFTAGNAASAAAQLTAVKDTTGVVAYASGTGLQFASVNGQPWVVNSGNAVANLGLTVSTFTGEPSTLEESQTIERGNMRWQQTINELESFSTPFLLGNAVKIGEGSPSIWSGSVQFTVGYEIPEQVTTVARVGEPNAGNVLVGEAAVKRAVARALTSTIASNREVFDPTVSQINGYAVYPNSARIQRIIAEGIDTAANISIVESNLSVTLVSGV